ncbi:50S ribosomal protein L17 [Marinoscillum sp. 108]|uniref:50S ribosomal protein L17 n=1 Tax=Marinoscillum sp. 108 TaxID=2653151 RepID=UPI0012F1FAF6|nr:50S ribosomal protein L17 [Marinoscillum sp. 108]VXD17070.1 50S ribosomal protein L17 [Marinoscillum sp. 108]
MRHGKKFNHLGRTASHRKAMLSNMASSLILHKRINTTVAKAKALRKYVEPLITKAKTDTTHSRRIAFSYLQDKVSVQELFGPIAEKISSRPGGYTRIIKTGIRLGDNAEMCMMELVDFNELLLQDSDAAKAKTRRSRRGGKKGGESAETAAVEEAVVVEEPVAEAAVAEEVIEEAAAESTEEEPTNEASDDTEEKEKSE